MTFDLGVSAQPRAGFALPVVGATITALALHRLPCCGLVPGLGDVVPQGTTGTVTEVRLPGISCGGGYVGACVAWDKRRSPSEVPGRRRDALGRRGRSGVLRVHGCATMRPLLWNPDPRWCDGEQTADPDWPRVAGRVHADMGVYRWEVVAAPYQMVSEVLASGLCASMDLGKAEVERVFTSSVYKTALRAFAERI